ncbi:unnamed protein product [Prorocentrum cordatum]|uniref:diacylglycerol O-acyltransferase n=1 Tax=Prorocentrum cordatum TaxID=2364126 RepID=A0ABN9WWM7_9DINO|nr:unnamed protein product [Polarella glacialis]
MPHERCLPPVSTPKRWRPAAPAGVWVFDDPAEPESRGARVPAGALDPGGDHTLVQVGGLGILVPPGGTDGARCVRLLESQPAAELYRREAESSGAALVAELQREVVRLRRITSQSSGQTILLKEGPLMRFRETMLSSGWSERYFEIRTHGDQAVLRCLRGPKQRKVRMEVTISSECRIVREAEADAFTGLHCFRFHLPPQTELEVSVLRLGATSSLEAQAWVDALELACGSAPSVESISLPSARKVRSKLSATALRAVHKESRESMLTSSRLGGSLSEISFIGVVNLCVIVLVVINFRLVIANIMKYGILLDPTQLVGVTAASASGSCLLCLLGLPVFAIAALWVELAASRGALAEHAARSAHGFVCALCLAVPIGVIQRSQANPAVGAGLLTMSLTLFMKLVSYAHTNTQLRALSRAQVEPAEPREGRVSDDESRVVASVGPDKTVYPANLSAVDMVRFLCFPTLVYQTSYPRSDSVRKKWLARCIGELVLVLAIMGVLVQQFIAPAVAGAAVPMQTLHFAKLVERVMTIAVPSTYIWLCMFYALFHLWLNILAEATRFGDRLFYKEWWNAHKIEDYWRLWNLPVHHWLLRHLFFPCLNMGLGKDLSVGMVFFVSAVLHELMVSIPCHTFRLWAFLGMMMQLPLVWLTDFLDRRLKGSLIGNFVFWISFCFTGQPLCIMLYYFDFLPENRAAP